MNTNVGRVKTIEYKGNYHEQEHDPEIKKVRKVLNELKVCQNQRKRVFKRGKKSKVTYDVYKRSNPDEWTIIGIHNVRKQPPRFDGFVVVITCHGYYVKTYYNFLKKGPNFFMDKIIRYQSYRLLAPKDYPVLDISEIKVRRSVR